MKLIPTSFMSIATGLATVMASDGAPQTQSVESASVQKARAALAVVELPSGPREGARWVSQAPASEQGAMVKAVAETLFAKHPTAIYATARALLQVAPDQSEALINAILSTAPDQLKSVVLAVIESDNDSGTATAAALKAIQQRAPDRLAMARKLATSSAATKGSGQVGRASAVTPFTGVAVVVQSTTTGGVLRANGLMSSKGHKNTAMKPVSKS